MKVKHLSDAESSLCVACLEPDLTYYEKEVIHGIRATVSGIQRAIEARRIEERRKKEAEAQPQVKKKENK